jgi:hypothetical protein
MKYQIGDRVLAELKSRGTGSGGWVSTWISGTVIRCGSKNVYVALDKFFYRYCHWLPFDRVKPKASQEIVERERTGEQK